MQTIETVTFTEISTSDAEAGSEAAATVVDQASPSETGGLPSDASPATLEMGDGDPVTVAGAESAVMPLPTETEPAAEAAPAISDISNGLPETDAATAREPLGVTNSKQLAAEPADHALYAIFESAPSGGNVQEAASDNTTRAGATTAVDAEPVTRPAEPITPSAPDPSTISARLKNLVVSISQVEELSRRAREAAASDLALFNGIAASQRQFEAGLTEARHLSQEAQAVYHRAFGREARAVAEPAVAEARDVEQAFAELADAWRHQAESFLSEHPDVELLLAEQHEQHEDARRHEAARAKAQRFQELVAATDAALRLGQLDDARASLKQLGHDFPAEAARLAPLQERLDHRVRAANDAAARRTLLQAAEFQGRGDFEAAVKLLEAVDVHGLSREASEDVFGRWSAACSLLGQTGGLELLRYSPSQGRGVILHRDPSVPYGLMVFSSLGMGGSYFEGRIVSNTEREGGAIVARARPFRAAEPLTELNSGWYGRTYTTTPAPSTPVRH